MRAVNTLIALLAATVAARFDGPCVDVECGTARTNCEADGMICVPFPSVDLEKRKGCTCSKYQNILAKPTTQAHISSQPALAKDVPPHAA
ncbi:hypothetical protein K4K60_004298 [Colletotrichum sp. SAR11_57]|nr:hypothetical protein K4K60_004298 [Colletotrichum sp. SAR11_57]